MIFKTAYHKEGTSRYSVKIDGLDGPGEKWANTTEAVVNYAKKTFKDGDEVDVEFTKTGSAYKVSRITRKGAAGSAPVESSAKESAPAPAEYKCSDCGKTLKDGKYQKCYECNKKNPVQTKENKSEGGRTDAVGQSIERQCALKAAANAVAIAMQGQITDMTTLGTMIGELYDIIVKKLVK